MMNYGNMERICVSTVIKDLSAIFTSSATYTKINYREDLYSKVFDEF